MRPTRIRDVLKRETSGGDVLVQGWIKTRRSSRSVSFLQVNDGSTLADIQVVVDESLPSYNLVESLNAGCSVSVGGTLVDSPGKGQKYEIQAEQLEVLGLADPETYPLQKKRHTNEFLREIGHLRPRTNTFGAMARVRNATAVAIHSFFQSRGFFYLQAPIITASNAEGAGTMFRVTTLDPTMGSVVDDEEDFFGKPDFLTVSGQLEAEIFALALSNVYTFGPTFRPGNSNTSRHLAEFWMVEPEVAFCDLDGLAELAEDFLKYVFTHVLENCDEDMARDCLVYRGRGHPEKLRRKLRVSRALGAGPSVGARAFPHREEDTQAGHSNGLPQGNKGVLHEVERRWEYRQGHGCSGPRYWRDHSRQPA